MELEQWTTGGSTKSMGNLSSNSEKADSEWEQILKCRLESSPRAGIFKQSIGARNRVGIGLSYRPARLVAGGIHSLESIPGLHKRLKIRAQYVSS